MKKVARVIPKERVNAEHRATFQRVIDRYRGRKVAVLGHDHADWDAAASGAALSRKMDWTFTLREPIEPSILEGLGKLGIEFTPFEALCAREHEGLVVVDINTPVRLPESITDWNRLLVIDHHKQSRGIGAQEEIILQSWATAEIVAELIGIEGMDPNIATALATGIFADTLEFGEERDPELFKVYHRLLRVSGMGESVVSSFVKNMYHPTESPLISDAMDKVETLSHKGVTIAKTVSDALVSRRVGSMLNPDFPISIIGSNGHGKTMVYIRINYRLLGERLGVDNPEEHVDGTKIMSKLGGEFEGVGGGHIYAGGCSGYGTLEQMLGRAVELVKEAIDIVPKST